MVEFKILKKIEVINIVINRNMIFAKHIRNEMGAKRSQIWDLGVLVEYVSGTLNLIVFILSF